MICSILKIFIKGNNLRISLDLAFLFLLWLLIINKYYRISFKGGINFFYNWQQQSLNGRVVSFENKKLMVN